MRIAVRKTHFGYIPQDEYNEELSEKHNEGDCYLATFKKQRNPGFHRLFFFGLNLALKNMPEDYQERTRIFTVEHLRKSLMLTTGRVNRVINMKTHEVVEEPQSIAFDNMDELEFQDLVKDCGYVFDKLFGWNPWHKDDRIKLNKK